MAAALTSLLRAATITDHEAVLAAAASAADASPSNVLAQRTRVVALLKLDRFSDALAVLSAAPAAVSSVCVSEKAYALYKTGRLEEAAALLSQSNNEDANDSQDGRIALAHLHAQVSYRAERFADAFSTYRALLARDDDTIDAERNDVIINLAAAAAQLYLSSGSPSGPAWDRPLPQESAEGSFETCFNFACESVARGDMSRAETFLARALELCNAAEDLTDEEREVERLPILVQIGYVQARLGRADDALDTLRPVIQSQSLPADLKPIVQANRIIAASTKQNNPFLVQRNVQSLSPYIKSPPDGLAGFQSQQLARNELIADLTALKTNGISARVEKRLSAFTRPTTDAAAAHLGAIHAAAHIHGATTPSEKIRLLQELVTRRPQDVGIVLALVQIRIDAGQHESALRDLRSFLHRAESDSVRYAPGLLALVMTLHRHLGHEPLLRLEIARVLAHCLKSSSTDTSLSTASPRFLQEAAAELLQSPAPGHLAVASAAFESLCAADSHNTLAEAGLVAACATTNYPKAEPYLANLPPISSLVQGIDVQALIDEGVATILKSTTTTDPTSSSSNSQPQGTSKKRPAAPSDAAVSHPKRSRKLPKNYEEGKTPDPERWLPLRDRSSYKPKGRKGKKRMAEATQGGAVKDGDAHGLDASAKAQGQQGQQSQQGQVLTAGGGGGANRRKKKGKK
jgi:signal recognition particle subunit SRP72